MSEKDIQQILDKLGTMDVKIDQLASDMAVYRRVIDGTATVPGVEKRVCRLEEAYFQDTGARKGEKERREKFSLNWNHLTSAITAIVAIAAILISILQGGNNEKSDITNDCNIMYCDSIPDNSPDGHYRIFGSGSIQSSPARR